MQKVIGFTQHTHTQMTQMRKRLFPLLPINICGYVLLIDYLLRSIRLKCPGLQIFEYALLKAPYWKIKDDSTQ